MEDNGVAAGAALLEDAAEALPASDAHDLKWAIDRLYVIEADWTAEDTATSRNDAKATLMVLEEISRLQETHESTEPCCPFCGLDPFHYVDNGVGMEAVAVTCCEMGDLYFRGARDTPEEVTLSWEEFTQIGERLRARAALSKAEGQ